MIFEVLSTASMAAVWGVSQYKRKNSATNDADKIATIAERAGLYKQDDRLRLYRRNKAKNYTEYVFKMPLGLSVKDFEANLDKFRDGLNNRSTFRIEWRDLLSLKFDATLMEQLRRIFTNRVLLDKQIELDYDGMLKFRVYDEGLSRNVTFDQYTFTRLSGWQVAIGESLRDYLTHDFEQLQMLVVAGMTRYGKTVFQKSVITTLIRQQPDNVKFTLIDLKGGLAFNRFANCRQVNVVAKNAEETLEALEAIHSEMEQRQALFLAKGWEDIGEAGWHERHFIVVDEAAEIAGFEAKEARDRCTFLLGEIARIGAGLGYRMVFSTQYPTADVFPRQVKANTSAALCFKLKNSTQSLVVLDRKGAEELPVKLPGRAIYQTDCDVIVQTPYISNAFINEVITPHINIRPRSDDDAPLRKATTPTGGSYRTIIEEA